MVLVGVDADPDTWQGWVDWRRSLQVGAENAQLPTLRTDIGAPPMTDLIEVKTCTCPSGNGSLRWPCPVHPPKEKQP